MSKSVTSTARNAIAQCSESRVSIQKVAIQIVKSGNLCAMGKMIDSVQNDAIVLALEKETNAEKWSNSYCQIRSEGGVLAICKGALDYFCLYLI